ncbi:MAG: sulfite exporter TauE/SafE family protein, partial [Blastocatellia bacterium]|nr:sulfite exporter TauE/SafE family protein [Blastocatellia bacterium]
PSLLGGLLGAGLLKRTPPPIFASLVPYLILFATVLFLAQEPIQRWRKSGDAMRVPANNRWLIGTGFYQFLIAVYGGYFGAGIGILMLAALGLMGLNNIHQMNGLKNIFASSINVVAALYFIVVDMVSWPAALLMMTGSIVGGYGAAGLARKLGQKFVRRTVIVVGLAMTISLFIKHQ